MGFDVKDIGGSWGTADSPKLTGEGVSEAAPAEQVQEAGAPVIGDRIVSGGGKKEGTPRFQPPPPDNPQAPIPTLLARHKGALFDALKKGKGAGSAGTGQVAGSGATAGAGQAGGAQGSGQVGTGSTGTTTSVSSTSGNLDQQCVNYLGLLLEALMKIADTQSKSKYNSLMMTADFNAKIFDVGLQNAQIAADIKNLAADKEMLNAVKSFMSAGLAICQMGAILQDRAKVADEMKEKYDGKIDEQNKKISDLQKKDELKKVATEGDADKLIKQNPNDQDAKDLKAAIKERDRLEGQKSKEYLEKLQLKGQETDTKYKIYQSFTDGLMGVLTSMKEREGAAMEKYKGIMDAQIQMLSKTFDVPSKQAETSASELNNIFQQMTQLSEKLASRTRLSG